MTKIVEKPVSDPTTDSDPFASMGLIKSWLISAFLSYNSNFTRDALYVTGVSPYQAFDECIGA